MKTILKYSEVVPGFGRTYFLSKIMNKTKIHTIRSYKYMQLDFPRQARHVIVGMPDMGKSVITDLTGYEELDIIHIDTGSEAYEESGYSPLLIVENKKLSKDEALLLALNDGFVSWDKFKQWFDKDQSRIILHFTDYRYGRS